MFSARDRGFDGAGPAVTEPSSPDAPVAPISGAPTTATPAPSPRRRAARPAGPLVAVLAVIVLTGAVVGMVWAVVTPAMSGRVVGADSAIIPAQEFPEEFAAVGTFAVLLLVYGVASVIVACLRFLFLFADFLVKIWLL